MKFLLDMGISPRTSMFLKSRGHGAVHLVEVELGQSDDAEILQKALPKVPSC